jgi:hypothetical protein
MTPLPKPGDILNYVFLFSHERDAGRDEGIKARPVIVVAVKGQRVWAVAVTTKGEKRPGVLPIPDQVARSAGLAPGSAVVINQFNHFIWLGFDIRPVTPEPGYIAGRIPPGFLNTIIDSITPTARRISRD